MTQPCGTTSEACDYQDLINMLDLHCHLDHVENISFALKEAKDAGVDALLAVSEDLETCRKNLEIKKSFNEPKIYLAMGMHPSEASLEKLAPCLEFAKDNAVELSAVGEIGLDFWYKWVRKNEDKKNEQMEVFRSFLMLAKELSLPVVVHSRGAWRECLETVRNIGIEKCVFHWYSGPLDVLKEIMEQGYFISATPSISYSKEAREAILAARIEQTLLETDCPVSYVDEVTKEYFKSAPKDVYRTLKTYCRLKNVEEEKAEEILTANANEFLGGK